MRASRTGGADLVADALVGTADVLPAVAVSGIFSLLTALLTNVVSDNASVVLMVPVAAEAAARTGASAFSFSSR